MTPTTAVRIGREHLGRPTTLAARPRGVLHVYAGPLTPSGCSPRGSRPVCGRTSRRLHDVGTEQHPMALGAHVSGRPLCRSCQSWLSRRCPAAAGAVTEQLLEHTAESVVWSVYAATSTPELDACRHVLLVHVPTADQFRAVQLPAAAARRWRRDELTPMGALTAERALQRIRAHRMRDTHEDLAIAEAVARS